METSSNSKEEALRGLQVVFTALRQLQRKAFIAGRGILFQSCPLAHYGKTIELSFCILVVLSAHVSQVYLTAYKIEVKYCKIGQFLYILNAFPLFVTLILHIYTIHLWNWRGSK